MNRIQKASLRCSNTEGVYDVSWLPCGSAGKQSACSAGDPGSIPGLKNPLEKGTATHCSILAWEIP